MLLYIERLAVLARVPIGHDGEGGSDDLSDENIPSIAIIIILPFLLSLSRPQSHIHLFLSAGALNLVYCSLSPKGDSIRRWRARHLPLVYGRCRQSSSERVQTLMLSRASRRAQPVGSWMIHPVSSREATAMWDAPSRSPSHASVLMAVGYVMTRDEARRAHPAERALPQTRRYP